MKPLPERLNDRLEGGDRRSWNGEGSPDWLTAPILASNRDPEVDELATLARRLQSNPHLQADPDFTEMLERRLLMHYAALSRKQSARPCFFPRLWRTRPALSIALGLCLLVLLMGTGVLVVTAQVTNSANPLYALKRWEQHVQVSPTSSPMTQAELDLQFARERLHTLADLANPAHAEAYRQAMADLDQQLSNAASATQALPAGPDRDRLRNELARLEVETRHTLRGFLPQLDVPERLVTTDELGWLGDTIPRLLSVEIILWAHPSDHAVISISGNNIQPGAHLLVDGRATEAQGSFQNGLYVFSINWSRGQLPQSIGILNPDGTAIQTTVITMQSSNGKGNSGNNGEHGNGNNGRKPTKTPTPHH